MTAPHAPKRVTREVLSKSISEAILEIVHGEGGLVQLAREVHLGDPNRSLSDENCEAVARILWEAPSASDMASAARLSGSLTSLFDLVRRFDLELAPEVRALEEWCETISPV